MVKSWRIFPKLIEQWPFQNSYMFQWITTERKWPWQSAKAVTLYWQSTLFFYGNIGMVLNVWSPKWFIQARFLLALYFTRFRKYYCPHHSLFQYIYPNIHSNDKMSIMCLVCHNKYDLMSLNFMSTHRNACKVSNQPNIAGNVGSEGSRLLPHVTNVGQTQNKNNENSGQAGRYNRPEQLINLDCLQFDEKRANTCNGNQPKDVAQCRICKQIFLIDRIKLLTHR